MKAMTHQDKNTLELITSILKKLYDLNSRGYFTAWLDWSGHTNGFYIKIIKGKWVEEKNVKPVYEALVCTTFGIWKDAFSGQTFDVSEFLSLIQSLMEYKSSVKVKSLKIPT
ncbi:hypothetical protein [Parabacteroides sp. HGS0025]|jgi:hypothetical protein|uniref:hypothetical protein n=1 Tax=Parabacteroides sp. HGS0025 TaxID=1078087 RepID=UPI00061746AF|nr:hypothetical protein [Parabacteroides sp. HGS0025]